MWNIREGDMGLFEIENRNRLSPDYIRIFYGGVFVYTSIPMLIMFLGVLLNGDKISLTPFETFLVRSEVKLYILELIFLIIFMSSKV
ncbi:hypothetical protein P4J62_23295, partial [Bacillus cereus]|nr:hypothetical protein [Bacillus cereus]